MKEKIVREECGVHIYILILWCTCGVHIAILVGGASQIKAEAQVSGISYWKYCIMPLSGRSRG